MSLTSSSFSTTTPSVPSKRHSLSIYPISGPRPLQLVNGVTTLTLTPSQRPSTPNHSDIISPSVSLPRDLPKSPASGNLRRHSSISYKRSGYGVQANSENDAPPPFTTPPQTKPRPRSVIYPTNTVSASRDRRSLGPGLISRSGFLVEDSPRPPLTLAEKHADLLRFIAQKESKCLELRSQLATHEAELLQLKRKWERIVSRSFESPLSPSSRSPGSTSASSSPSQVSPTIASSRVNTSPTITAYTPSIPSIQPTSPAGIVLEGIKESVHGMSRLIAAGLTASTDIHPDYPHHRNSSTSNITRATSPQPHSQPQPKPKPRPQSLYSQYPYSHIRTANLSTSSSASTNVTATTTTSTTARSSVTRFSAASFESASSFSEEADLEGDDTQKLEKRDVAPPSPGRETLEVPRGAEVGESSMSSMDSSELIVRDTGATPLVSPNLKFRIKIGRRRGRDKNVTKETEDLGQDKEEGNNNNGDAEGDYGVPLPEPGTNEEHEAEEGLGKSSAVSRSNSRCYRRKSRDVSALPLSISLDDVDSVDPSNLHLSPDSDPVFSPPRSSSLSDPHLSTSQRPRTAPSTRPVLAPSSAPSKRSSHVGMLPPVSTIPGLSLAESAAMVINGGGGEVEISSSSHTRTDSRSSTQSQHPPSSWMGKKWESFGFQRSTLSKSQKRASGLLSDVSHTLASAFSLSTAVGGSAPPSATSLGSSWTPPPLVPSKPNTESVSWLDQEDNVSTAVREPMKPTVITPQANFGKSSLEPRNQAGVRNDEEGDSEWSW